jgi:hypothetical protein
LPLAAIAKRRTESRLRTEKRGVVAEEHRKYVQRRMASKSAQLGAAMAAECYVEEAEEAARRGQREKVLSTSTALTRQRFE